MADKLSNAVQHGLNNDKIELFNKIASKAKTQSMSVIKNFFDQQHNVSSYYYSGHLLNLSGDADIVVSHAINTKPARIADYRQMSNYNEIGDAVDEIADAHMTTSADNKFVNIGITGKPLNDMMMKEVEDEANHFFGLFNFEDNIFEYARRLTIEGELCWENIVSTDDPSKGFIDVRYIPNETFEFAYDTNKRAKTCIAVVSDSPASDPSVLQTKRESGFGYNQMNSSTSLNCYSQVSAGKVVYLPFEQITYINSGIYDGTGLIVYPALERARRAYNQLQLIEDAVLVYRLVRAPVRNVFNVDCGKMSPQKAEQHVRNLAHNFTSKKQYDPATGSISGAYDPFSILENVWIPKSADSSGVTISSIGGEAKWGELDDLNYFLRKLYRALKIPSSRFISGSSGESPDKSYQYSGEISYDEYRFAKYINRSLTCLVRGLKEALINHLKLTGTWQRAGLNAQNLRVIIPPPADIEIYKTQKLLETKISNYNNIIGSSSKISIEFAQSKILGLSKRDIEENRRMLKQEMIDDAILEFKLDTLKKEGLNEVPTVKSHDEAGIDDVEDEDEIPASSPDSEGDTTQDEPPETQGDEDESNRDQT